MTTQFELHDLGASLTDALENMRAGEEITIAHHGNPMAEIVSVQPAVPRRGRGLFRGQIWVAEDFNTPLPEDELLEWEK